MPQSAPAPQAQMQECIKYDFGQQLYGDSYREGKDPFSDVKITFQDESTEMVFYAHKVILAASSTYFKTHLKPDSAELHIECDSAVQCANVMCWIYCPSFDACYNTVKDAPADFVQKYMDAAELLGVRMHEVEYLIKQRNMAKS